MIVPDGVLGNEVGPGSADGPRLFARDGYVIGRRMLPPEPLRAARRDIIRRLAPIGHFAAWPDADDKARWSGHPETGDSMMRSKELLDGFAGPLLDSGLLEPAIERLWGRPPVVYRGAMVTLSVPEDGPFGTAPHRDIGPGGAGRVRFWVPLTGIDTLGGGLALAVGSHRLDRLPEPAGRSPYRNKRTGEPNGLAPEDFAGTWRAAALDVGDVLLFRPDIVHASTANQTPHVRIAIPFFAQDARDPVPATVALSNLEISRGTLRLVEDLRSLGAAGPEIRPIVSDFIGGHFGTEPPSLDECRTVLQQRRLRQRRVCSG